MRSTVCPLSLPVVKLIFKEDALYAIGRAGDVRTILQHLLSSPPGGTLKAFLRQGGETGNP